MYSGKKSSERRFRNYTVGLFPQEEVLETARKSKRLSIGIPKELDENENRIALTPLGVEMLVEDGHEVIIEAGAGIRANFKDTDFSESGAFISGNKQEIFSADIVLKIAPFKPEEIDFLKGNQCIFSAVNIGTQSKENMLKLLQKRITAVGFELLMDENDCFPVVHSMSEINGSRAILIAAEYLSKPGLGKGKILGGISGVNPSEVVILGAGTAGEYATRTALGLGALVKVFDSSPYRLRMLQQNLTHRVFTSIIQSSILLNSLKTADVVIGAMELMGHPGGFVVSEEMIREMKPGSVLVDIAIDQGGCFESSRLTTHSKPYFLKHGVVHYCVPNIASGIPRTASYALSNIFIPILLKIANSGGIHHSIREDAGLLNGIYVYNGVLTNSIIGNYFDLPWKDIGLLLAHI